VKAIELTAGVSKPPFVIENNKSYSGIQLDLIRAIFAIDDQAVNFIHLPLVRSFAMVDKWHSDGTITLPNNHQQKNVYVSLPYISYKNVAVSLAEDNLAINKLADLANKHIIAFQMAQQFLGPEYSQAVSQAQGYREMADQMKQIEMLFLSIP
jgi:polar amino acid transport system substrate-binding protein